jgi:hypothetical protein
MLKCIIPDVVMEASLKREISQLEIFDSSQDGVVEAPSRKSISESDICGSADVSSRALMSRCANTQSWNVVAARRVLSASARLSK